MPSGRRLRSKRIEREHRVIGVDTNERSSLRQLIDNLLYGFTTDSVMFYPNTFDCPPLLSFATVIAET